MASKSFGVPGRPRTPTPDDFIPFGGDEDRRDSIWTETVKNQPKIYGPGKKRMRFFRGGKFTTSPPADDKLKMAKKRPRSAPGIVGAKVAKTVGNKTATSVLNEISPGLEYKFDDVKGPPHEPCFTVHVFYAATEKEYIAIGGSKKIAKNNLAIKILKDLGIEIPEAEEKPKTTVQPRLVLHESQAPVPTHNHQEIDFASDDVIMYDDLDKTGVSANPDSVSSFYTLNKDPRLVQRIKNIPNLEENACLAVNCLMNPSPAVYEELSEEGPPHNKTFTYKLTFMSIETYGKGPSKKKAKADAARQVLMGIFGPQLVQSLIQNSPVDLNQINPETQVTVPVEVEDMFTSPDDPLASEYTLAFSDRVHRLVQQKYEVIMKDDPEHAAQKVLAAVIMTVGSALLDTAEVIVVTTGTKCIEGDSMSELGISVNDCHAEILATRCLRDFLYTQMEIVTKYGENSVFQRVSGSSELRFELKNDVRFHLYISTSPCGDARIFSPKGVDEQLDQFSNADSHPNRLNRGLLRAKIEAGEGTIPVSNLPVVTQTWDSIVQGNALNTMSCSDKICRWNATGVQGALISILTGPIYYSSIILGSLHHPIHFKRAIIGRIEPLESQELPPGYRVSKPHRLMVSCEEPRRVKKSPNHAVTWCVTWGSHEVLAAAKGRCKAGNVPSQLCKRHAFTKFLKIYRNNPAAIAASSNITYADAKQLAKSYQLVKQKFNDLMEDSNFGKWISKPIEADNFKID